MGSPADHRAWSVQNADLARRLATESDAASQRWAVVAAYYAVMHALQAVAAENGEQRAGHPEVIEIPVDFDLSNSKSMERKTRELHNLCNKARYLRGSNSSADNWFAVYTPSADLLVEMALGMMESVLADLGLNR